MEHTLLQSHLLWGEFSICALCCSYSQSLQFSFLVPPGTHHCWVDRGSVIWEACPTPLHMAGNVTRAAVTHPSTNRARSCLTSVIWWELVTIRPCATKKLPQNYNSLINNISYIKWFPPTQDLSLFCRFCLAWRYLDWEIYGQNYLHTFLCIVDVITWLETKVHFYLHPDHIYIHIWLFHSFNHHPSLIKECICDTRQSSVLASQCHIGKTEV